MEFRCLSECQYRMQLRNTNPRNLYSLRVNDTSESQLDVQLHSQLLNCLLYVPNDESKFGSI